MLDGYEDFRVPSILELATTVCNVRGYSNRLVLPDGGVAHVDTTGKYCGGSLQFDHVFPEWDELEDAFFSSTQYAGSVEAGQPLPWVIRFNVGLITRDVGGQRVRCVRSER